MELVNVHWRIQFKRIQYYTGVFIAAFALCSICTVYVYKYINPPNTLLMWIQKWQTSCATKYSFVTYDKISVYAKKAVIASEDQLFMKHSGFDMVSIQKALSYNKKHRKKRGASTISQQTAKNIFLWPSRSWLRKGLEVWFTLWLEWICGKKRILELYLNCVEMGPCIYGIEAAAQYHYHIPASKLNADQAATIAALLPAPVKFSKKSNRRTRFQTRVDWIKRQMKHIDLP